MNVYICKKCQVVIEKIVGQDEELYCCNEKMEKLVANESDGIKEKHMPQTTYENNQLRVCVGEVMHPCQEEHYIAFIQLQMGSLMIRKN